MLQNGALMLGEAAGKGGVERQGRAQPCSRQADYCGGFVLWGFLL